MADVFISPVKIVEETSMGSHGGKDAEMVADALANGSQNGTIYTTGDDMEDIGEDREISKLFQDLADLPELTQIYRLCGIATGRRSL